MGFIRHKVFVLLLLLSCIKKVLGISDFVCHNDQPFCRWVRSDLSDWSTAFSLCTESGGSLLSWKHIGYTEEWMNSLPNVDRVWTSLKLVNHRFQWQYQQPEYLPILDKNWCPGHEERHGRDCVVANNRTQYESVFCNSSYPTICVIEQSNKQQLTSLVNEESTFLKVKLLKIENGVESELVDSVHLNVDRNDTMLMFKCNVSGHSGRRSLVFSWIKDGVYLSNNRSDLTPAQVDDKSKTKSMINSSYQKQGTYRCQVREFGSVKTFLSTEVLLTYNRIYNGVVTLWTNSPTEADSVMQKLIDSIIQLSKEDLKLNNLIVTYDPLYHATGSDGVEYRYSLYIDLPMAYHDNSIEYTLNNISQHIAHTQWGVMSVSVSWATYCPRETQVLPTGLTMTWKSSWSHTPAVMDKQNIHCLYTNNSGKPLTGLTRQCLHDFTRGATRIPLDFTECDRIVGPSEDPCLLPDYQWMASLSVCYRVTKPGSWSESLATCFNDFPAENVMHFVEFETLLNVAQNLQEESDLWLPVCRSSIYGPLLFYSTTDHSTKEGEENWMGKLEENWMGKLEEDECQILTSKEGVKTTSCSNSSLPSICVYHPALNPSMAHMDNLCPTPWRGHRIHQNQLVCYSLITLNNSVDWTEAEQVCHREKPEFAVNASMATFETPFKAQLWEWAKHYWTRTNRDGADNTHSLASAFIGLSWSEKHKKFCWLNDNDCNFEFSNWHPSAAWENGFYGTMTSGGWGLKTSSGRRTQVLCEATIDLAIHREIRIESKSANNKIRMAVVQSDRWTDLAPRSFANLSQFLALEQRSWTNFPSIENRIKINCYADGKLFRSITNALSADVSISFESPTSLHCEGWIGWPRRYVRSQDLWIKPIDSEIFLLTLEAHRSDDWNAVDFQSQSVHELDWRLDDLHRNNVEVHISAIRWNVTGSRLLILLRMEVSAGSENARSEQGWLQLIRNVLLQTHFQSTYQVVDIRSTVACSEVTELNNTWSSVPIGRIAEPENPCVTDDGRPALIRTCLGSPSIGAHWSAISRDETNTCRPATELLLALRDLSKRTLTGEIDSANALDQLANYSSQWQDPSAAELSQAVKSLEASLNQLSTVDSSGFHNASQSLVNFMESSPKQLQGVQSIPGLSDAIVTSLEQLMGHSSEEETFEHPKLVLFNNIDQQVVGFGANVAGNIISNSSRIFDTYTPEELVVKDVVVLLPINEIKQRIETPRLSFSLLANADLIDAQPQTRLAGDLLGPQYVIASPIIVAQVGNSSISNLAENVRILFRSARLNRPLCVYWDKIVSGWSTSGCRYAGTVSQDSHLHICECNHLTPLAILIPYFEPEEQEVVLSWISMIGCAISMVSLSLVMLTFLLFSKWRQSLGNKILFNLSAALFGLMCSFLTAGHMVFNDRLCKAVSVTIHYFLLSSFSWMLVEAVYQYITYVVVVGVASYKSRFMRKAMPLAWGLPIIPIIALLIYDPTLYLGQSNFCWMNLEAFYPSVLGPVSAVLTANVVVYLFILKSVFCFQLTLRSNQSHARRTWYQLRLALCVFFLLGLSWIFGFLTVGHSDARMIFAYLFCIFNSFQGLAIFVFFVLRERNARKLWTDFASVSDDIAHSTIITNTRKTFPTSVAMKDPRARSQHQLSDFSSRTSSPNHNSKYFY